MTGHTAGAGLASQMALLPELMVLDSVVREAEAVAPPTRAVVLPV